MTDEEILSLYLSRSEEAITATQEQYERYCRSLISRLLDNPRDVEEVLSDTWLRAWQSIPPNRPRDLKLYLARISRNLACNRIRSGRAAKRGDGADAVLEELAEVLGGASTEEAYGAKELEAAVNRFLHTLPRQECGIFLRRCFHAESIGEIARHFGLRENTVTVTLHRTRKKLRAYLTKEGYL